MLIRLIQDQDQSLQALYAKLFKERLIQLEVSKIKGQNLTFLLRLLSEKRSEMPKMSQSKVHPSSMKKLLFEKLKIINKIKHH